MSHSDFRPLLTGNGDQSTEPARECRLSDYCCHAPVPSQHSAALEVSLGRGVRRSGKPVLILSLTLLAQSHCHLGPGSGTKVRSTSRANIAAPYGIASSLKS